MVVAPYNAQWHTLREWRKGDRCNTRILDKFRGQGAVVVFFSMTASNGEDMTCVAGFLFSRNRFNVAISRARCLAYLVCTDELLYTRAWAVEHMRLIATLKRSPNVSVGAPNLLVASRKTLAENGVG